MTTKDGKGRLFREETLAVIAAAMVGGGVPSTAFAASESLLHSFAGGTSDGANPYAGVAVDFSGTLYGATFSGGSLGQGIVYKLTSSGAETVICNLPGGSGSLDGAGPAGTPVLDTPQNIYGTAAYNSLSSSGIGSGNGVVYKLTPSGSSYVYSVLHQFGGASDGAHPFSTLVLDNLITRAVSTYTGS